MQQVSFYHRGGQRREVKGQRERKNTEEEEEEESGLLKLMEAEKRARVKKQK